MLLRPWSRSGVLAVLAWICAGISSQADESKVAIPDREGRLAAEEADRDALRTTLPAEVLEKAKTVCPEMLETRLHVDRLRHEYERLALMCGLHARREALRDIPRVKRELEEALEDLADQREDAVEPLKEAAEDLKDDEEKLIERIERREKRGREAAEERAEADKISAERGNLRDQEAVIETVGTVNLTLGDPHAMLLDRLIKATRRQEPALRYIRDEHERLVEGRIYIANVDADLGRLKNNADQSRERRVDREMRRLERKRQNALQAYRGLFLDIREEVLDELADLRDDEARLMPRVERDRERGRSGRYEKRLSALHRQIERMEQRLAVLDRFVEGTGAVSAEELQRKAQPENKE